MKEEAVAWMSPDGKVSKTEGKLFYIPLYTTPQTKQGEPVAWTGDISSLNYLEDDIGTQITLTKNKWREGLIPLYTTPQTKPLSDEEIIEIADNFGEAVPLKDFARAIEERHGIK